MVREITYTVTKDTKGIVPATKQWAGMQYEDNATKVIFDLSELITTLDAAKTYKYRIDFNSSSAGYDPSGELEVSDNKISREIPAKFTQYGGEIQITAVITEKDDSMVCYSFPVTVFFTAVKKEAFSEAEIVKNISAMEEEFKEVAEASKNEIDTAVKTAKSQIQDVADSAYTNIDNRVNDFENYATNQISNIDSRVSEVREAANDSETSAIKAAESEASAQESAENAETAHQETLALKDEVIKSAPKVYTGTRVGNYGSPSDDHSDIFVDNPDVVNAKIGDLYINTDTHRVYQCVLVDANDFVKNILWKSLNIEGKEEIANKITDLFVDNESLGKEQYPTALAAKTYTDEKVSEAVSGKEDTANRVTNLKVDPEELTHEQYPSAKATTDFVAATTSGLWTELLNIENEINSIGTSLATKENVVNKVSSILDYRLSEDKYPSVFAVNEFTNIMASGLREEFNLELNRKVDKEEGKTLYRGMELIYEYTYTAETAGTTFSVTLDTNNEPFKLEEFVMRIIIPATETDNTVSQYFTVFANAQEGSSYRICFLDTGTAKKRKLCMVEGKRAKKGFWYGGTIGFAGGLHETDWRGLYNMEGVNYITSFNNLSIGSASISGTKVEIYGRKVDL